MIKPNVMYRQYENTSLSTASQISKITWLWLQVSSFRLLPQLTVLMSKCRRVRSVGGMLMAVERRSTGRATQLGNFFHQKFHKEHTHTHIYTGCPRRNVPDFGRAFLMLKYTDITQNTYVQSWTVTEIMDRAKCGLLAGPRTVHVSWQSYPFPSLSVVSYDGISAHASHWTAHVGLYRNVRSAMLRHRWAVMCHVQCLEP